ncbi:purine-cytosine permease family protein [Desulfallas thermosapovorans]|uniref:purine-cytosine permease family protein n=1 Tax=Desulfallas thermosapovorans TaxID=58137 RepID=UPI00141356A6|nr:cytosine permease [Desulfallas thermosapovorans]
MKGKRNNLLTIYSFTIIYNNIIIPFYLLLVAVKRGWLKVLPVFHIEKYGLDAVPQNERTATWFDLFTIWSGVSICLPSFIVGTLLVPACIWSEAVQINFWGNLIVGVLIVLGGYFGTKTGFPAVVMGRYVFGYPLGQWLPTTALLISTLGWYAVMTVLTGMALAEIAGHILGPVMLPLITALVGLLNASTAVAGFHKIRLFNRLMVPLLALFCIYLAYNVYIQVEHSATTSYHPSGNLSFGEGIDLIIGSVLAGAFSASDFSRYAINNLHNWLGTLPGTFVMSFLLGFLAACLRIDTLKNCG